MGRFFSCEFVVYFGHIPGTRHTPSSSSIDLLDMLIILVLGWDHHSFIQPLLFIGKDMLCHVRLLVPCIFGCVISFMGQGNLGYTYLLRGQAHWLDGKKGRKKEGREEGETHANHLPT